LRDAHVRAILLSDLKSQLNKSFQSLFEQLETLNHSYIKRKEHLMLNEQKEFLSFKEIWINNDTIESYFKLEKPDPLKIPEIFAMSYLKSFNAFNISIHSFDPDLLHEWRKRLKDVQSQFELLYDHISSDLYEHYQKIQDLCNVLGELNDLEMINRWIANIKPELSDEDHFSYMLSEEIVKQHEARLSVAKSNGFELYTFTPEQFKDQLF
tara:strand:- start:30643 stop:31272 length:630 start_codon:yes stop_codon:yes gene_type:complete